MFNGLNYELVRHAVLTTSAPTKVIIVDCCFSGRAIDAMADDVSILASQLDISGTYIMTSTGPNDPANAPPESRNTAFTGELLYVLRHGISDAGAEITLKQVYDQVERNLRVKGLPHPDADVYRHADKMMLVRNAHVPLPPAGATNEPTGAPATDDSIYVRSFWRRESPRSQKAKIITAFTSALLVATVIIAIAFRSRAETILVPTSPIGPIPIDGGATRSSFVGPLVGVGDVQDVAFSPNGKLVATAGGNDHTVLLWNADTGERARILVSCCVVDAVAFSADSKLVATDGDLYDVTSGRQVHELSGGYSVAFSPDGRFLAVGSGYDPSLGIRLYSPSTGELIRTLSTEYTSALAFHQDGKILASATGYKKNGIRLWNPDTSEQIRTINGGSAAAAFSPDGKILATSGDGTVQLWNPATGDHIRNIDAIYALAFRKDGKLLTAGEDTGARLYDPVTGDLVCALPNVYAKNAAFSPDGKRIATVTPAKTVELVSVDQDCR